MISTADKYNRRKDTRAQIIGVAQGLILADGIKNLSLRRIAETLGIRPPSIYTHFASIEAIIEAVSIRAYGSFANIGPIEHNQPPRDTLKLHINSLVDHMVENPTLTLFLLHDFGLGSVSGSTSATVNGKVDVIFQNVQSMLDYVAKDAVYRSVPAARYLAYIFGAGLIGLVWSGFGNDGELQPVAPVKQIKADLLVMAHAYLTAE